MVPIHHVPKPSQPNEKPALPLDSLCYLIGSDGIYKQMNNEFYSVRLKVGGVIGLAEIGETASLHVPKLPMDLFRQVEAFFIGVFQKYSSEAVVLLLANPTTAEWLIEVPPQAVKGLHVSYSLDTLPAPPPGFQRFGSIHSHASVKAFHSGTDDADEVAFDGLHITIGNVDQPVRSYSARWMLAGKSFPAALADIVEAVQLPKVNENWLAQVKVEESCWGGQPHQGAEMFPADTSAAGGAENFDSLEEYHLYLEQMREEVDERLLEVGAALGERR
jgi:hypothetical protein